RRSTPRFQGENFQRNLDLVAKVEELAAAKGVTPAQLALAWVVAQGDDIVPIPGTRRIERLEENIGALDVGLTAEGLAETSAALPEGLGDRYSAQGMATLDR